MIVAMTAGLLTGLSLILAIGAQNAYVLRQGLLRSHVGAVVLVCALSDAVLIVAGVAGIGTLVDRAGWVLEVVRWLGVAFLLGYAAASLRRAAGSETLAADAGGTEPLRPVLVRVVALTWLNPHVYLDTVLLLGSIAAAHDGGGPAGRWWFAAGACVASVLWFTSLGYGARLLAPLLARPRAWQVLDVLVAVTMVFVAANLALGRAG
ncbi:MAG TPA: LysE/ArgO family amino acid transporter [Nocardioides sp.]|nr:LysE/ArgO family amino acid transporter [Nocardioides sp.]